MAFYQNYTDPELLEAFRSGEEAAFREIYDRYDKLLYAFAFRKLRDGQEAMDVVHDVFAWLVEHRETLFLKTSLSSYLYKATLNRVFDVFRKQDRFRGYIDAGDHYIEVDSRETDFLIREKEVLAMVEQEIGAMPPRMREVYLLRYREHLTAAQIAERLGITEQTAATHIKHGKRHLRDKLGLLVFLLYVLN